MGGKRSATVIKIRVYIKIIKESFITPEHSKVGSECEKALSSSVSRNGRAAASKPNARILLLLLYYNNDDYNARNAFGSRDGYIRPEERGFFFFIIFRLSIIT